MQANLHYSASHCVWYSETIVGHAGWSPLHFCASWGKCAGCGSHLRRCEVRYATCVHGVLDLTPPSIFGDTVRHVRFLASQAKPAPKFWFQTKNHVLFVLFVIYEKVWKKKYGLVRACGLLSRICKAIRPSYKQQAAQSPWRVLFARLNKSSHIFTSWLGLAFLRMLRVWVLLGK